MTVKEFITSRKFQDLDFLIICWFRGGLFYESLFTIEQALTFIPNKEVTSVIFEDKILIKE